MNAKEMADLHLICMPDYFTWNTKYYDQLLHSENHIFEKSSTGFGCARVIKNEAEILILLVHPNFQRLGYANSILKNLHTKLRNLECNKIFLEVARDNIAARNLYRKNNYSQVGERKGYYSLKNRKKIDGLIYEIQFS
tara:strand:+ start:217 stop:630 length:414 start_codon:yes stop_codon:yes gene_type:complete